VRKAQKEAFLDKIRFAYQMVQGMGGSLSAQPTVAMLN